MTDTLRDRIAAVYRAHRLTFYAIRGRSEPKCDCGWRSAEEYATYTDHPEHVADAVIRELDESATECWDQWPARRCLILGTVNDEQGIN